MFKWTTSKFAYLFFSYLLLTSIVNTNGRPNTITKDIDIIISQSNPNANLGDNYETLSEYGSITYQFNTESGDYKISLTADPQTDYDLYVYDYSYNSLASSEDTFYPEEVTLSTSGELIYIEVISYYGSGAFTLTITKDTGIPTNTDDPSNGLPSDFTILSTDDMFHLYKMDNVENKDVTISLDTLNGEIYFAILDTSIDLFIIDSIIRSTEYPSFNPHNLFDTYDEFSYSDHQQKTFLSSFDTLYLVVYTYEEYSYLSLGYKLTTDIPSSLTQETSFSTHLTNEFAGEIHDNGDEYWDTGEFVIHKEFQLSASQTIDLFIDSYSYYNDELIAIFFQGSNENDINNAMQELFDFLDYGITMSSGIYNFLVTYSGIGLMSYRAVSAITLNVAVFAAPDMPPIDISYVFYTNIGQSAGVINSAQASTSESSFQSLFAFTSIFILVFIFRKKR